jgi:isopentenyldiphosphate isomerase
MDYDEILDVVNSQDHVVGSVKRNEKCDLGRHRFLRAAELFIQNRRGELWVPRRTLQKTIAPSGLDYSVSGHASYFYALKRETNEELGINLGFNSVKCSINSRPQSPKSYFSELFTSITRIRHSLTTQKTSAATNG